MDEIYTETIIEAPAERIWSILMDFERYPQWNPFVSRISGIAELGQTLRVRLTPPGGMAMSFKPTVISLAPERAFRWLGHLLVRGLFDGEHSFELEPLGPDRTRFVQKESFTGFLTSPILLMARKSTLRGFDSMNRALKQLAEGGSETTTQA